MREMRHAGLRSGHAEIELDRAVERDEQPRRHRDRRNQQHDDPLGEEAAEGEQQPEDAAGCADRRIRRRVARRGEHELRERGGHHRGEVVLHVALRADGPLDLAAEHVQREHVEEQMHQAAVQEAVGHHLPRLEAGRAAEQRRRVERPEGEPRDQHVGGDLLQQVHRDVDDDQDPGDGRNRREHGRKVRASDLRCKGDAGRAGRRVSCVGAGTGPPRNRRTRALSARGGGSADRSPRSAPAASCARRRGSAPVRRTRGGG